MTSSTDRRTARSRRVAAERAAQAQRERRKHRLILSSTAATVLALVVGLGVYVQAARNSTSDDLAVPAGTSDGSFVVGEASAPVTVTLYEDFLCPACAQAQAALGGTLDALVEDGSIRVDHRPIAILDGASTDRYSTRALNVAACVIDSSPDSYPAFHSALFTAQPREGGPGLSDAQLAELAADAGASGTESCIDDLRFGDWTKAVTDRASQDGVRQTPTILVNGVTLAERTPQALRAAVAAAS